MKDYEFRPEAEEEMNRAALLYEDQSEGLGLDFLEDDERTIESILAFPKSGLVISTNIRRRIVHRFPFGVLYAIHVDHIVIVAIAHQRRPGYWKDRV